MYPPILGMWAATTVFPIQTSVQNSVQVICYSPSPTHKHEQSLVYGASLCFVTILFIPVTGSDQDLVHKFCNKQTVHMEAA